MIPVIELDINKHFRGSLFSYFVINLFGMLCFWFYGLFCDIASQNIQRRKIKYWRLIKWKGLEAVGA
jgi:hypothetical protein